MTVERLQRFVLVFSVLVPCFASVFFIGGYCIDVWCLVTSFCVALVFGFMPFRGQSPFHYFRFFAAVICFAVGVYLVCACQMQTLHSHDAAGYHFPIIRFLISGWNPIFQGTPSAVEQMFAICPDEYRLYHVLAMQKGVYYFNAAAYFFVRNPFNLQSPLCVVLGTAVCISFSRMRIVGMRWGWLLAFLCSLIFLPGRAGVDMVVALSAIGLLVAFWRCLHNGQWCWLEMWVYSFWMCNAKQTGGVHCAVFWIVFLLSLLVQKRKVPLWKMGIWGMGLVAAFVLVTASPYLVNWREYGHPLYPRYTSDEARFPSVNIVQDFLDRNEDAKQMGHLTAYANAFAPQIVRGMKSLLGEEDFEPRCGVWMPDNGGEYTTPTNKWTRFAFWLMIGVLVVCGGGAERTIACMILVGTLALPTEMVGYLRYTPWALCGIAFCLVGLLQRGRVARTVSHICGLAILGVLVVRSLVTLAASVDRLAAVNGFFKDVRPTVICSRGDALFPDVYNCERVELANLKLLKSEVPELKEAKIIARKGGMEGWKDFYDGSFQLPKEYNLEKYSLFHGLIVAPPPNCGSGWRRYFKGWLPYLFSTYAISLPKNIYCALLGR